MAVAAPPRSTAAAPRRKRYEQIAEHVELQILSNQISVGDRLPSERELMDRFGVGRSTVREALFRLQRMGLVELMQGAPARATRPTPVAMVSELSGAARHFLSTPEGVRHFQHARLLLEVGLVRDAAQRADETTLGELASALDANRCAIGNQLQFQETDIRFHFTLAQIAGNPIFISLTVALRDWLSNQRELSVLGGATQLDAYSQHAAIFDAIAARDPARAEEAMENHLKTVAELYWRAASGMTTESGEGRIASLLGDGQVSRGQ